LFPIVDGREIIIGRNMSQEIRAFECWWVPMGKVGKQRTGLAKDQGACGEKTFFLFLFFPPFYICGQSRDGTAEFFSPVMHTKSCKMWGEPTNERPEFIYKITFSYKKRLSPHGNPMGGMMTASGFCLQHMNNYPLFLNYKLVSEPTGRKTPARILHDDQ